MWCGLVWDFCCDVKNFAKDFLADNCCWRTSACHSRLKLGWCKPRRKHPQNGLSDRHGCRPQCWISSAIFARHAIEQHVFDYDQLGIKIEFREHSRQRADFPKALGDTILCWRAMPANTEVADTPWRRMAGTRMPCVEHLRFLTLAQTR